MQEIPSPAARICNEHFWYSRIAWLEDTENSNNLLRITPLLPPPIFCSLTSHQGFLTVWAKLNFATAWVSIRDIYFVLTVCGDISVLWWSKEGFQEDRVGNKGLEEIFKVLVKYELEETGLRYLPLFPYTANQISGLFQRQPSYHRKDAVPGSAWTMSSGHKEPTLLGVRSKDYSSQASQLPKASSFFHRAHSKQIYSCVSTLSCIPSFLHVTLYLPPG